MAQICSKHWAWLAVEYHARVHDTTERAPLEHFLAQVEHLRPLPRGLLLDALPAVQDPGHALWSAPRGSGGDLGRVVEDAQKQACQMFPLKRCGGPYELNLDGYKPEKGAASSWPAGATRMALHMRLSPDDHQRPAALTAYRLYAADAAAGLKARAWVEQYLKAFAKGDVHGVATLEGQIVAHPPVLRSVVEAARDRARRLLLQQVLHAHDPLYLRGAAELLGLETKDVDPLVPRSPPPRAALWGLRALYEVSAREPSAFPDRRDEVCADAGLRGQAGYTRICQLLGARSPVR